MKENGIAFGSDDWSMRAVSPERERFRLVSRRIVSVELSADVVDGDIKKLKNELFEDFDNLIRNNKLNVGRFILDSIID